MLIESALFSIQIFWCASFLLPKRVLHELNAACRRFLWNGLADKKGIALVIWDDVCLPYKKGGLNFKEILSWNKVSLAKLI